MNKATLKLLKKFQQDEINAHFIYKKVSDSLKDENKKIFIKMSEDEIKHYNLFKKFTGIEIKKQNIKIFFYILLFKIFGLTFLIKYLERDEDKAQRQYLKIVKDISAIKSIFKDEQEHEKKLIKMIKEEKLNYISSMVLGLNDALVELTGALAGFTFALQNSRIVGLAGLITGISASFSMAASEYLSQKHENTDKNPGKAAIYTGLMYIAVVFLMVIPYFLFKTYYISFLITIIIVFLIIFIFTFFVSVVQEKKFNTIFFEMLILCFSVVIISFLIGFFARKILNIEIG